MRFRRHAMRATLLASIGLVVGCGRSVTDETVPVGSTLIVRLLDPLSSEDQRVGDRICAETIVPLYRARDVLVPAGAHVEGKIVDIDPYGNARMTLAFVELENRHGEMRAISGRPITLVGVSGYRSLAPSGTARHESARRAAVDTSSVAIDRETMIVPADDDGTIEIPRGQALAVHIVEPADAPAGGSHSERAAATGEDETS